MINQQSHSDFRQSFWEMTNNTQLHEKYQIDQNLQYLQFAPLPILKKIFIQYRFFTHYYIADLTLLINKLPFGRLKSILADILSEELGHGNEKAAHPDLYDDFLMSIGVRKEELIVADEKCIHILENIQQQLIQNSWAYGVGLRGMGGECLCQIYLSTMYEYFSKNSSIIAIQDQITWDFWHIHIGEIDLHHQEIVRKAIDAIFIQEPKIIQDLFNGYLESKDAWDNFWKQIFNTARETTNA